MMIKVSICVWSHAVSLLITDFLYVFLCSLATKKECLLCGVTQPTMNRYRKHFASCHTIYGSNRQCGQCGQFFFATRNLRRHTKSGKCPGAPMLYCVRTGRMFYHGRDARSMRKGDLITRKSFNENALVATCHMLECVQVVPIEKERVVRSMIELPLANIYGTRPSCVHRIFNPSQPDWQGIMVPVYSDVEPRNRAELDAMTRSVPIEIFRPVLNDGAVLGQAMPNDENASVQAIPIVENVSDESSLSRASTEDMSHNGECFMDRS